MSAPETNYTILVVDDDKASHIIVKNLMQLIFRDISYLAEN